MFQVVARMERSDIRGTPSIKPLIPDFAPLNPGYEPRSLSARYFTNFFPVILSKLP
jgi:hypothetical protein